MISVSYFSSRILTIQYHITLFNCDRTFFCSWAHGNYFAFLGCFFCRRRYNKAGLRCCCGIIWEYQKLELGDYLRRIDADLGLMLSVVPETFSYTLSELWAAGIPVLATRLGAFEDRIVEAQNGWLIDPVAQQTGPVTRAEKREQLDLAALAMEGLPARDRELVRLMTRDVPIAATAERLGMSVAAAQRARLRAVERFRKIYRILERQRR